MSFRFVAASLALILPLLSTPTLSLAQDDTRPVCKSQIQGRRWPDAANSDRKLISILARCGELLICVRGTWHYHWEAASVRVDQLGKGAKSKQSKPSGCEVQAQVRNNPESSPTN